MKLGLELGDIAAWAGFGLAALSFAWHVANEMRARAAARRAMLTAEVITVGQSQTLIHWSVAQQSRHTVLALRVRMRTRGAALQTATVTGPMDQLVYIGFGTNRPTIDAEMVRSTETMWARMFVTGLPTPESPFVVDVTITDAASGRPIMRRRKWSMRGARTGLLLQPRH